MIDCCLVWWLLILHYLYTAYHTTGNWPRPKSHKRRWIWPYWMAGLTWLTRLHKVTIFTSFWILYRINDDKWNTHCQYSGKLWSHRSFHPFYYSGAFWSRCHSNDQDQQGRRYFSLPSTVQFLSDRHYTCVIWRSAMLSGEGRQQGSDNHLHEQAYNGWNWPSMVFRFAFPRWSQCRTPKHL